MLKETRFNKLVITDDYVSIITINLITEFAKVFHQKESGSHGSLLLRKYGIFMILKNIIKDINPESLNMKIFYSLLFF